MRKRSDTAKAVRFSRSAITGRFAKKSTVKRHPSTTVTETRKKSQ